jgi:DNA-binding transcriptional ArsR family regulator
LRDRELTAGELARVADLTASNASRHLACLHACGLIERREQWRYVYYRLASVSTSRLLEAADSLLAEVGDAMAACDRPEMP